MSQLLEKLNAEQERLDHEYCQSNLNDCCAELRSEMLRIQNELQQDIMFITIQNNIMRLKDMHDFIYSNPTLKGDTKELVWLRFVEIYKINHASEVSVKFDHDVDSTTEDITFGEFIDLLAASF